MPITHVSSSGTSFGSAQVLFLDLTTSGDDRYLVVELTSRTTSITGNTFFYNDVPMTKAVEGSSGNLNTELWVLKDPDTGTNTISGTLSGFTRSTIGASCYDGVDTTGNSFSVLNNSNAISGTLTTAKAGSWIVGVVTQEDTPISITNGTDINTRWDEEVGTGSSVLSSRGHDKETGSQGDYLMDFTFGVTDFNSLIDIELIAAGGTSGFGYIIG